MTDERPSFDLQSHSQYSDGELPPAQVVQTAADEGVRLLALTDHDSVDGVDEALEAATDAGIELVPAAELSAVHGGHEDLHVLGFRLDHTDRTLNERLGDAREDRVRRADEMAGKLAELGFEVDHEQLHRRRAAGLAIGRPHLTQAVVSHPANRARLEAEDLTEVSTFLPAYLIPGRPAYLPRTHPTVPEAIQWIHDAGGVAVWAHPFWDINDAEAVLATIDAFVGYGLDGVEIFYSTHTAEQTQLLGVKCAELDLLTTGSSDFHGPNHRLFDRFRTFETFGVEVNLGIVATPF
ncbi:MAG TPA: PHP domain-containing protein [Solirubrobacteraceae bacterium]|nr:PHP domain-containing protein [Solirubrobacteraceae bacterium]